MNDPRHDVGASGQPSSTPPGWYPEPVTGAQRWWDGRSWGPYAPGSQQQWQQPQQPLYAGVRPAGAVDERNWAMWSHLGPLLVIGASLLLTAGTLSFLAFVFPLVVMTSVGSRSARVRAHAVESLNFQLSMLLYSIVLLVVLGLVTIVTFGLGLIVLIPALLGLGVFEVVAMIIAAVRASNDDFFRYPLTIRFVR